MVWYDTGKLSEQVIFNVSDKLKFMSGSLIGLYVELYSRCYGLSAIVHGL